MPLLTLSEESIRTLQAALDRERRSPVNPLGRQSPQEDGQSPEVYVAKIPSGGISALSGVTPGRAACDIYRLILGDSSDTLEQIDLQKTVYNLGSSSIPAETWVLIARDKFGAWYVISTEVSADAVETGTGGEEAGFTGCRAVLNQCEGVVEYWRYASGILLTVDTVPCPECFGDTGTGTSPAEFWWCMSPPGDARTGTFGGDTGTGTGIDNAACIRLTIAAKDVLVAQGWIVHGSSHASLILCQQDCVYPPPTGTGDGPPGTIVTSCCPDILIPELLYVTVTLQTGSCTCVVDFQMTYNHSVQRWESGNICGYGPIYLACLDAWNFSNASVGSGTLVSSSCSPFQLVFDVTGGFFTCVGTWRATITG